jgi:hypothetical protein
LGDRFLLAKNSKIRINMDQSHETICCTWINHDRLVTIASDRSIIFKIKSADLSHDYITGARN